MDAAFWHERWQSKEIGFHEGRVNRLLEAHLNVLGLEPGARIFMPLCGKAFDIQWLHGQGFHVLGAELSEIAIRELFDEMGLAPDVTDEGGLLRYRAERIDIFVGDVFELGADLLGPVEAVYDRAAVVALPAGIRGRYAAHVAAITGCAPQLVITFDYDQTAMEGPPFSVPPAAVEELYARAYSVIELARAEVAGKLKGQVEAMEIIWLMRTA